MFSIVSLFSAIHSSARSQAPKSTASTAPAASTQQSSVNSSPVSDSGTVASTAPATTAASSSNVSPASSIPAANTNLPVPNIVASTVSTQTLSAITTIKESSPPVDRDRELALAAQARTEANAPSNFLSDLLSGASDDGVAKSLETSEKKFFAAASVPKAPQPPAQPAKPTSLPANATAPAANQNAVLTKPYVEFGSDEDTADVASRTQSQAA